MIERIKIHTLKNNLKVGDRVTPVGNYAHYGRSGMNDVSDLQADKVYVVTGVHVHPHGGGTVSIDGASNALSPHGWAKGSFGYALFDKVETPLLTEASIEDLIAELKSRGTVEGTFTVTTTATIDL